MSEPNSKIQPELELWLPPEELPAEVEAMMPKGNNLEEIRELLFGPGAEQPSLDMILGLVNHRRREVYTSWKAGTLEVWPLDPNR